MEIRNVLRKEVFKKTSNVPLVMFEVVVEQYFRLSVVRTNKQSTILCLFR